MAKKVLLQDLNNVEILPITRGELILDSSGKQAFHSNEFLATTSQPGLLSAEDKFKIDTIEEVGNIANNKVEQINTTTSDIYRLLFSETADDETRTEGARKSAKLTFNPSTGALQASALIGNIDGTYINKLTGYTKATLSSDITPEDTLISALGKVEFRAEIAYNLIQSAYDGDGTIENLNEILKVLEGIKDTETIQAIIGKYLPLTGGSLSGVLSINTGLNTNVPLNIYRGTTAPCISFHGGTTSTTKVYGYLGFGSENVLQCWDSDGTTGRIILHSGNSYINNGTITINGVSITPLTSKPSYAWSEITGKPTTVAGYGITDTFKIVDDGNAYLNLSMPSAALSKKATSTYIECWDGGDEAGWWNWKAGKWITVGGTSSHFVKGDGSLDSTTYATSASLGNYLPLTGGTLILNDRGSFSVKRNKGNNYGSYIQYENSVEVLGQLGMYKDSATNTYAVDVYFGNGENYWLIHTGNIDSHKLTTITKSITLTKDWKETGISLNPTNFPDGSGTYVVQVYVNDGNQGFWGSYFSGIMSAYVAATNGTVPDDEIILHHSSHACSKQIYLKTKPVVGSTDYNKLYIACNTDCSSAISITFKFKKLI